MAHCKNFLNDWNKFCELVDYESLLMENIDMGNINSIILHDNFSLLHKKLGDTNIINLLYTPEETYPFIEYGKTLIYGTPNGIYVGKKESFLKKGRKITPKLTIPIPPEEVLIVFKLAEVEKDKNIIWNYLGGNGDLKNLSKPPKGEELNLLKTDVDDAVCFFSESIKNHKKLNTPQSWYEHLGLDDVQSYDDNPELIENLKEAMDHGMDVKFILDSETVPIGKRVPSSTILNKALEKSNIAKKNNKPKSYRIAAEYCKEALEHYMNHNLLLMLSFNEYKSGEWLNAIKTIKKAKETVDTDKHLSEVSNTLGFMYTRIGEYDKAINEFNEAIKLDENQLYAHSNLATVYHILGIKDKSAIREAVNNYKKELKVTPEHPYAEKMSEQATKLERLLY